MWPMQHSLTSGLAQDISAQYLGFTINKLCHINFENGEVDTASGVKFAAGGPSHMRRALILESQQTACSPVP
jgi:hypothetical protein